MLPRNLGYSLWIMPDGAAYSLTSGYISKISTEYHLPMFEPHITVLGEISSSQEEMTSKTIELANRQAAFRVRLAREVDYLDEYFRCLFIRAQETSALMETFTTAREIFGYEPNTYFPHLSLAYGNIPIQTKREMIQKLGTIPTIEFEARDVSLALASTSTPISSWKIIDRFPFTRPPD